MAEAEKARDRLLVALHNGTALVQVHGRGTFKVSSALKKFGLAAFDRQCRCLVFDMSHCIGMDSTFMGVIAGLATELKQRSGRPPILVNLNEKTKGLLVTLGLDQVVQTYMAGCTPEEWQQLCRHTGGNLGALEIDRESRADTAETMLEAHERLVDVSPENYPRFKDVLAFLREDIDKAGGGGTS